MASLLIRFIAGPLCDRYGPRWVFGGLLLVGSVPLGLSPLVHDATGLYVSRFFLGILGGSFVPCMVWSTGFFDKNVVGTANALTGGWGNAGGGITYFIMPAVLDSFHRQGYSDGQAWRMTFIVPLVVTIVTGVALIALCPDTPTGRWADRHLAAQKILEEHETDATHGSVVDVPGSIAERANPQSSSPYENNEKQGEKEKATERESGHLRDPEAGTARKGMLETARGEIVAKPTFKDSMPVLLSAQTAFHAATYFCSFGGELAINSILSAYYVKNFPSMGQTNAANWAAMFGFLNFVTRPLGGVVADLVYKVTHQSLWAKKIWIMACGCVTGALLIVIGRIDPHEPSTMFGLIALMAIFLEAGNGANFALVPHVHPHANGVVSGTTGAVGNLGGVVFAIIFRFMHKGTDYAMALWVIGVMTIGLNLILCWVPPVPRGQISGH